MFALFLHPVVGSQAVSDLPFSVRAMLAVAAPMVHPTVAAAVALQIGEDAVSREITVLFQEFNEGSESTSREITVIYENPLRGAEVISREVTVLSENPLRGPEAVSRDITLLSVDGPNLVGNIVFSDLSGPWGIPPQAPITVAESDGTVLYTVNVLVDASGNFSVPVPNRSIRLSTKVRPWLRRTVAVAQSDLNNPQTLVLMSGDIDGDNEIGVGDYAILSFSYGKSLGDPGFEPFADLDRDDEVSIGDFAILSQNYGEAGDEP